MVKRVKRKNTGPTAWAIFSRDYSFYFPYDASNPRTWKLLDTGAYGIVQLRCIELTARKAFMAGFRFGTRASKLKRSRKPSSAHRLRRAAALSMKDLEHLKNSSRKSRG
jgi:hypothetical protein